MRILDRYVARTVATNFLYALAVLLAIFSIINLMQELEEVGTGGYGLRQAMVFVLLTLPNEAYRLIPAAALLGAVTGLGGLANNHELVAMTASGVSPARLSWSVLQGAAVLMVAAVALGEVVAAPLALRAQSERSAALSGGLALAAASGFWARDGSRFVNVRNPHPDGTLHELYVYEFDAKREMTRFTYAERASYENDRWTLENVIDSRFTGDSVVTERKPSGPWDSLLAPRQLGSLFIAPEDLSIADLYRSIRSLRERNESSERQQLALWRRLSWPLVTAVMVYVGLPFVLASFRRATIGKRIAAAALVGIGFQMINETFGTLALAYGLAPSLSALLPGLLALIAGAAAMSRVR